VLKKTLFLCAIFLIAFGMRVYAFEILFEHRRQEDLARGVRYEENRMMTSSGMLDVHVLFVDLHEPHISIAPVASSNALGRREAATTMLSEAGAIAGINADFFGLAGAYSVHFGSMINDGEIIGLNSHTNRYDNHYATFFLDWGNNSFFRYAHTSVHLYNNGKRHVDIVGFNNIGHLFEFPVLVNRRAMINTAEVDARFSNVIKISIAHNQITHISQPGQLVVVPYDGYVLLLPYNWRHIIHYFRVGERADVVIDNNIYFNMAHVQTAISGGGLILYNGVTVYDGGVAPSGRHPRSALGVSQDGRQLILMTVDGRSHSVGATHSEMAAILRHYGAHNAMHFDGGGSTTMVTRQHDGRYSVANTLPEGSQRRIINALGVFNNSPISEMYRLVLEMEATRAVVNVPLSSNPFGQDQFWNRLTLTGEVQFHATDPNAGFWQDGRYIPMREGAHILEASYQSPIFGELRATTTIHAYHLAELQPQIRNISVFEGQQVLLRFVGTARDGEPVPIPAVTGLRVSPAYLGHFENGYFVATRAGVGYISAVVNDIRAYIPVTVGGFPRALDMHNLYRGFMGQPYFVTGMVQMESIHGRLIPFMSYTFTPTTATQAAHMTFYPAIEIEGEPIALRLHVHGDGSGHWLRGRVRDGNGVAHNIDFVRHMNFIGWETVTALLPNVPAPFSLESIYLVTLESDVYTVHMVYFYGLEALFAPERRYEVPQGTRFTDRLRVDSGFMGAPGIRRYEFSVPNAGMNTGYFPIMWSDFSIVNMTARNGGISATDRYQWGRFMNDIRHSNPRYVAILIDENPFNFRQRMEFELFHLAMKELSAEGRLVFVVSSTAQETTLTMRDGIRYINLAQPEYDDTAVIRFWVDGNSIMWSD